MKQVYGLKFVFINLIYVILNFIKFSECVVHIELKKSEAKFKSEYLKSLKFMQKNIMNPVSSFLEEKDISLHQQVLAQKRLATYYGELEVGFGRNGDPTKTQTFKMLFDTGSCEFWVPSSECNSDRCLSHTRYQKSDTYKSYKNAKMAIQYLSGKVEGDMCMENIRLGDLIVHNQVIGVAKEVDIPLLKEVIWDGILGLAYPNKNLRKKGISPLFDSIIQQGVLTARGEKNQFAYYLGLDRGAITFGGADMQFKKDLNEEFKWAPIAEKNYWTITLMDIRKYKTEVEDPDNEMVGDALCPGGCKAIVDTGTYLIYGPSDQLQSFLSDMTLNSCEDRHKLPSLGFIFKGYTRNGKDEAFELILTPNDYVLEFEVNGKHDCVIGIGSDSEDSGWTLGQVFLRAYYTVFDRESEAIGFVKSDPAPGLLTPVEEINEMKSKQTQASMIPNNVDLKVSNKARPISNHNVHNVHNAPQNTPQNTPGSLNINQMTIPQNGPVPISYFSIMDASRDNENRLMSFLKNNNI